MDYNLKSRVLVNNIKKLNVANLTSTPYIVLQVKQIHLTVSSDFIPNPMEKLENDPSWSQCKNT